MIYVLLLVSLEIREYIWKVFLDQWENYRISTRTFYMKLHTLQVSTENWKVYKSDRNQKEITIEVDNKSVNNNSDLDTFNWCQNFLQGEIIITN